MAAMAAEDTLFGIIKDQGKEEHVLCIKDDKDSSVPRLCITAVNTKLAQTLQCQVNLQEPAGITLTAIKAALVGGKIRLDSILRVINITLMDGNGSLSEKMDVLSENNQNKEIGMLLYAMIKRIANLEKTIVGSPVNNLKDPIASPRSKVMNSRKRTRSLMNMKQHSNIHLAGIQYESSSESD